LPRARHSPTRTTQALPRPADAVATLHSYFVCVFSSTRPGQSTDVAMCDGVIIERDLWPRLISFWKLSYGKSLNAYGASRWG
jgi:hypothetical protein